jgi:hypothetical protein
MGRAWMLAALGVIAVSALAGCGTPLMHPAATGATALADEGLPGEWSSAEGTEIRAVILAPESGAAPYRVTLTVRDGKDVDTTFPVELTLTQIGANRYADLFLARPERDALVQRYGFLVLPVHQVLKVSREGDTLRVWPFRGDWLEERSGAEQFAHDTVVIGGGEAQVVTARTDRLRELLARHGDEARAFGDPITLRRTGR